MSLPKFRKSGSAKGILLDVFTSPTQAFSGIREGSSWAFPFVLLVACTGLANGAYFFFVDPDFMLDDIAHQIVNEGVVEDLNQLPEIYQLAAEDGFVFMTILGAGASAAAAIFLLSAYFSFLSLFSAQRIPYKSWLAFTSWCCVPNCLASISTIINCGLAPSGRIPLEDANPLSTLNVLGPFVESVVVRSILAGTDITMVWSIALMVVGHRIWNGSSYITSLTIVTAPICLLLLIIFTLADQ